MIERPDIDELLPLLRRARDEDLGTGDITSEGTIPADANAVGTLLAKEGGVLCGTILLGPLAGVYAEIPSPLPFQAPSGGGGIQGIRVELAMNDGDGLTKGAVIGRLIGPARAMLALERVALNFLQRLSGVAAATRQYVDAVAGTAAKILDTRKTTPGWRSLEKYAVRCGGGANHRTGLFDAILVKDNHIALGHQDTPSPAGGGKGRGDFRYDLPGMARQLRQRFPRTLIEIEVDTLDQLRVLLAGAADAVDMILLDNMTVEQMAEAVRMRNQLGITAAGDCATCPLLEASGGVTLATVRAIARTGVERISVGAITHSARAMDISLEMLTST